jgi:hypothetical protein
MCIENFHADRITADRADFTDELFAPSASYAVHNKRQPLTQVGYRVGVGVQVNLISRAVFLTGDAHAATAAQWVPSRGTAKNLKKFLQLPVIAI